MPVNIPSVKHQGGVVLMEALISILIFSIGILAVVGLQAAAVSSVSDAKYRVDASAIAERVIGQMWVDQTNLASYVGTNMTVPELPQGKMDVAVAGGTDVTVTVKWQAPASSGQHQFETVARIYGM